MHERVKVEVVVYVLLVSDDDGSGDSEPFSVYCCFNLGEGNLSPVLSF